MLSLGIEPQSRDELRDFNEWFSVEASRSSARGRSVEVDALHHRSLLPAVAVEVAKVLERNLALLAHLESLLAALAEILDGLLETDAEVVGGVAQDLADRGRNAVGVGVDVVHGLQLSSDLGRKTMGQGVGDLVENVVRGGKGY